MFQDQKKIASVLTGDLAKPKNISASRTSMQSPGIGISVQKYLAGGILITKVLPNTPASKAGIKSGDVIIKINNQDVKELQDIGKAFGPKTRHSIELYGKPKNKTLGINAPQYGYLGCKASVTMVYGSRVAPTIQELNLTIEGQNLLRDKKTNESIKVGSVLMGAKRPEEKEFHQFNTVTELQSFLKTTKAGEKICFQVATGTGYNFKEVNVIMPGLRHRTNLYRTEIDL